MRRAISGLLVLSLSALLFTGDPASAQKAKKAADKDLDDKNSEKLIKAGVLVGRVVSIYDSSRKIKLQVSVPVTTINNGAVTAVANAQVQYAQARARRDLNGMRDAQMTMVREQLNLYRTELKQVDVEVEARDDVVVLTARPKADFDDKGRVKKYTKAELAAMKSPDGKGYKAEFGDVAADQIIRVQLVRKKPDGTKPARPAPKPAVKKKGKKAKDDDLAAEPKAADLLAENGPGVSQIVILGEAPPRR